MGAFSSRQSSREEEVDTSSNISYRYPPKSGNYFGSHFIMGGEKFDTPQPEAYLFGENADLNFLGNKPTPFPYPPPQSNEPYKTLKALVNIRKESLRFVKVSNDSPQQAYNIEFIFDCDVPCSITIHFFATEDTTNNTVSYIPKNPSSAPPSKSFHYKKGASQLFSQPSVTFTPSQYEDEELIYNMEKEVIPIVIHCVTLSDDGQEDSKQSHTSIAVVDHHADGCYTLKGLKQKLYVDGLCYLLQEIYGIENKNNDTYKGCEDCEDGGSECVICMCDIRDTLILPCRHLCLCYSCADSLRYQANNCPICRAPFRALLQIRALQKNSGLVSETSSDNIPSGYDAISLIEALNGPCAVRHPPLVVSLDPLAENPDHQTAGQLLNRRASGERGKKNGGGGGDEKGATTGSVAAAEVNAAAPEIRMSALLASSQDLSPTSTSDLSTSEHPPPPSHPPPSSSTQRFSASSSSCSPPLSCSTRKTAPLRRDKSLLRPSTLTTATAGVQKSHSVDENETPDDDSEAEKLSPLLDAGTSTELDSHDTSATPDYYGTKSVTAMPPSRMGGNCGSAGDTDLAEYYSTNTKSKKHHQKQDLADFYGTNNTIAVKSAKQARSPMLDDGDVENGLGEYFGSDMQLQVEIVESPSSPDVRTTITQAGCGGSTVDTVQSSQPVVPGVNKGLVGSNNVIMGSNNGIAGSIVPTGDESDYYTPDEPCTTILSPVQESVESQTQPKHSATSQSSTTENGVIGGTPILKNNNWNTSLPGTPLSTASHRSSGDSYSSSSSTKQLLTYENSTLT